MVMSSSHLEASVNPTNNSGSYMREVAQIMDESRLSRERLSLQAAEVEALEHELDQTQRRLLFVGGIALLALILVLVLLLGASR